MIFAAYAVIAVAALAAVVIAIQRGDDGWPTG